MSEKAAGVTPEMRLAWPSVDGADAVELFDHLAGEAGAGAVVEPVGDGAGFVGAEAVPWSAAAGRGSRRT